MKLSHISLALLVTFFSLQAAHHPYMHIKKCPSYKKQEAYDALYMDGNRSEFIENVMEKVKELYRSKAERPSLSSKDIKAVLRILLYNVSLKQKINFALSKNELENAVNKWCHAFNIVTDIIMHHIRHPQDYSNFAPEYFPSDDNELQTYVHYALLTQLKPYLEEKTVWNRIQAGTYTFLISGAIGAVLYFRHPLLALLGFGSPSTPGSQD